MRSVLRFWAVGLTALACGMLGLGVDLLRAQQPQTLSVPLPAGCIPALNGFTVVCATTPPPQQPPPTNPPPSPGGGFAACGAAGYTMQLIETTYSVNATHRVDTGLGGPRFGNNDALVIHFKTPAVDPTNGAQFIVNARGGAANVNRVAALALSPCIFPKGYSSVIPAANTGQAVVFTVGLKPALGIIQLLPSTDYYITVVNRDGFSGGPSCYRAGAFIDDCPVYIDAN